MPKLKYRYDWNVIAKKARSRHQIDTGIGSIEDAVNRLVAAGEMQDPYEKYRELENKAAETRLHASRGRELQWKEKQNVLEFDIGGSGYTSPKANHAHLGGKENVVANGAKASIEDINNGKKWSVHFWNKISFLQKLPKAFRPKTEEEIRKHNELIDEYSKNIAGGERKKGQKSKADYLVEQKYGKNSTLDSLKDKKEIRVKEGDPVSVGDGYVRRVRYSMPGPQGTFLGMGAGISNSGTYSIQNLSQYMLDAGKDYLTPIFEDWKKKGSGEKQAAAKPEDIHPVSILLRGHSRGGVAISHGAMRIKDWIHKEYPQFEKYVNFEMMQMDPVAGYGSDHGVKRNINLNDEKRPELLQEMKERGMRTLGKNAETTVVYSIHTNHDHFFSPQAVDGAKRIILTAAKHSVNLGSVDRTQEKMPGGKAHREGYMDAATGEMYRNSGLNELPAGVYIADEKNRLIRIPNAEVGRKLLKDVLKDVSGQEGRHKRIDEVMDNWFKANDKSMDKDQPSFERVNVKNLQNEYDKKRQKQIPSRTPAEIGMSDIQKPKEKGKTR